MDSSYSKVYAELHQKHWWWLAHEEVVIETLRRYQSADGRGTILDVGCGDGLFFGRLGEFGDVEGVEPDAAVLGERFRGQIYAVPFDEHFQPGKQYSVILMLDVLEHLADARTALRHALDLLVPGGILLITLPAFPLLWTRHDDLNHHVQRFTKTSFRLAADGLPAEILEERYLFQALFAAKIGVRAVESLLRLPARLPSVPPAWINRALRGYLLTEEKLFRRIPVPLGSSLLVVARKRP